MSSRSALSNSATCGHSTSSRKRSWIKSMRASLPMLLMCRNMELASRLRSTLYVKYCNTDKHSQHTSQGIQYTVQYSTYIHIHKVRNTLSTHTHTLTYSLDGNAISPLGRGRSSSPGQGTGPSYP